MSRPTHAYLAVCAGVVQAICVDTGDKVASEFAAETARCGGDLVRVPLDQARGALFEPWPPAGSDA